MFAPEWVLQARDSVYMDGTAAYSLRRPGVPGMVVHLVLPFAQAEEFYETLTADPEIVREPQRLLEAATRILGLDENQAARYAEAIGTAPQHAEAARPPGRNSSSSWSPAEGARSGAAAVSRRLEGLLP